MSARQWVVIGALAALCAAGVGTVASASTEDATDPCPAPSDASSLAQVQQWQACEFDRLQPVTIAGPTVTAPTETVTAPPVTETVPTTVRTTATQTVTLTATATATSTASPTATTAATTTLAPPAAGYPNATNTGVPAGTTLTAYSGPMTITTDGTVIDAKTIKGTLIIKASGVKISRSKVVGIIDADASGISVTITDSEVDGGTSIAPAIGYGDITMSRVNVHGARVSVSCGSNCTITDSWLHGQYVQPGSDWHVNGYISNGGSNVVVRHNTIACDVQDTNNGGGCTGPAASFGDFAPLRNITYDNNLFVATPGGYCLAAGYNPGKPYGSDPQGIVVTNNVFQRGPGGKCGYWGAVTSYVSGTGNAWSGNKWDDGSVLNP